MDTTPRGDQSVDPPPADQSGEASSGDRASGRLSIEQVAGVVARAFTPAVDVADGGPGAVGLEVEQFLMRCDSRGRPGPRVSMAGLDDLLSDLPGARRELPGVAGPTGWTLPDGSRLVPEPGAQLEHAGRPAPTAAAAIRATRDTLQDLATHAATRGLVSVAAGLDPFHLPERTSQQLAYPRYPAMHGYLGRRSPHGHVMMTSTASIQVNLDLGHDPAEAAVRWATAMLVAPLATATFACSPVPGAVNGRAVVWQWLDPTRTGIPQAFIAGEDDPVRTITDHALSADVLLFRDGPTMRAGEPGFTLGRWLDEGHPVHGWPDEDAVLTHLSTLFPEVRARGFLELRSIDALPERWRAVPVVLYCGLLYDPVARTTVRSLLESERSGLGELLTRGAHLGLADPRMCALAVEVWTAAAEGARRLPAGYVDAADLNRAERFIDTFTMRGRSPSDELRERLASDPASALGWAREPRGIGPAVLSATTSDKDQRRDTRDRLIRQMTVGRRWTHALLDPLDDESMHRSHSRIMSPLVWDLGHIGNFEELWLLRALGDRSLHDEDLDRVYNPFDNPRWVRADLPLLRRPEATAYLVQIRRQALDALRRSELDPDDPLLADGFVHRMVLQHEAQHQETMLQTLDLRGDTHGTDADEVADTDDARLALYLPATARTRRPGPTVDDLRTVVVPAGSFDMGAPDPSELSVGAPVAARDAAVAAYDNERPRQRVHVDGFAMDVHPVTARRFAAFIADGGYLDDRWWSARGRSWLEETGHGAPQGWLPDGDGGWRIRRFNAVGELDPRELVEHVSFFEAEAFAAWAGGRLPTEAEWEKAAAHDPATDTSRPYPWGDEAPTADRANLDRTLWGPSLAGAHPRGASAYGVQHLLGDSYEWTTSAFEPYEGYRTFPYPEYSEVFFGGDWTVLRGASWATRAVVARSTFRNWDHPYRRQIFSGIRVAYDLMDGRPDRPVVR